MAGLGFLSSYADNSLFVRHSNRTITVVLIYVDDLIITGNAPQYIQCLISQLNLVFEMKNLGKLHHFLGIEVNSNSTGLFLSQTKYAKDLLSCISMFECKPCGSPSNYKFGTTPSSSLLHSNPSLYRSITGCL